MKPASGAFAREVGRRLSAADVPAYAPMLDAYQRAHRGELRLIVESLPLQAGDQVLDLACGAGTYSVLLAERVAPGGAVVGLDIAPAYLDLARQRAAAAAPTAQVVFQIGDSNALPFDDASFDLSWCAQSMYTLPHPVAALREMRRVTRAGGTVVVLENDTLHHIVLPWPADLELAVRWAQFQSLNSEVATSDYRFIGRDLCAVFAEAGYSSCTVTPYTSVRHAPLDDDEHAYLRWYLADLAERAEPLLDPEVRAQFLRLVEPDSQEYMLRQTDFFVTYTELVAQARVEP